MVDSPHTLTTRHKASLQKFIEKNDWIQTKIELLESSELPAIDTDEALLDEDVLSRLVHEHDRIEAEVQELDNGELRALRLLAKGESHRRGINAIFGLYAASAMLRLLMLNIPCSGFFAQESVAGGYRSDRDNA
jgi:hypothetical protein